MRAILEDREPVQQISPDGLWVRTGRWVAESGEPWIEWNGWLDPVPGWVPPVQSEEEYRKYVPRDERDS